MKQKTLTFIVVGSGLLLLLLLVVGADAQANPPLPANAADASPAADSSLTVSVASKFSYQGRLSDGGGAALNGDYAMQFRLYDTENDGALLWDGGVQTVAVANGLFNVELAPDPGIVNGQALWLEVMVEGEALPRQEILPVPYAMSLVGGASISGFGPDAVLTVTNPDGPAILATDGGTAGGHSLGENGSELARLARPNQVTADGRIKAYSTDKNAVYGESQSVAGVAGVSTSGNGVYGGSTSSAGVYGESTSSTGVYGRSTTGDGVNGVSDSGVGVYGWSKSGLAGMFDGNVVINGELKLAGGKISTDGDGEIYANSYHGPRTPESIGTSSGVLQTDDYVFSMNSDGSARFVSVEAEESMAAWDVTVRDQFKAKFLPGLGENRLSTTGLEFLDAIEAVIGSWSSADGNLFTTGNLTAEGTKNAIVFTENSGKRKLYAEEAAEVYFFDRGQGQLVDGAVTITLDPVFLETVTIDTEHPMLVQITLSGDCNGVFVAEQTGAFFTVKELMGGASAATFNWEVAAKRKGYEDDRLEPFMPEIQIGDHHE